MTKTDLITRRRLLSGMSVTGMITIAGCSDGDGSQDDIKDSDGDGVIDSEDYAPQDPEVQERSDIQSAETETETESYDPDDYYGLPKCDGSRPIQLIDVQDSGGLIQNVSTDDLLVFVSVDDGLGNYGDWCGYYIVEAGQQAAFESPARRRSGNLIDEIHIVADDDTSRNRDRVCNQGNLRDGEDAGCVSLNTFRAGHRVDAGG